MDEWSDDPMAWLRARGGTVGSVRVAQTAHGGAGLVATEPIVAGDLVLSVPSELVLVADEAVAGADELHEGCRLSLRLLTERARGAASPWHAWLASLPPAFDTPLHWADSELRQLRCPRLIARVDEEHATLQRLVAALRQRYPERAAELASSYLWAVRRSGARTPRD